MISRVDGPYSQGEGGRYESTLKESRGVSSGRRLHLVFPSQALGGQRPNDR